eukprot:COSAG02_NODE_64579_length_260_cov_0.639752_1_plen_43_part_01
MNKYIDDNYVLPQRKRGTAAEVEIVYAPALPICSLDGEPRCVL